MSNQKVRYSIIPLVREYQRTVKRDIDRIISSSPAGLEKTVEGLKQYARYLAIDSKRFGDYRDKMAVYAHQLINRLFPGDPEVEAYIGCMDTDW